ncbi:hypothetical protein BHM03_00047155 [Ensete ventricosum]|nr:hypothetical protein BHM03_00047155 [Ensete ventricosum]
MDLLPLVAAAAASPPPVWLQYHTFLLPVPVRGDQFEGDGGPAPPEGIDLKPDVVDDLPASGSNESRLQLHAPSCFKPIHLNQLRSDVKATDGIRDG